MPEEYISRKAALMKLMQDGCSAKNLQSISDMHAADVAEVVRCKTCKWVADNNSGEWYGCQMFQVVQITPEDAPKPDDFCSYGERKEDSPCD